ncbi:MAG: heme A synthase, partial [Deltaproteobacteria bacterium]
LAAALAAIRSGPARARPAARFGAVLVLLQVLLGAWTVWSMVSVTVVSLHLAGGALLLADSLLLFLQLGPRPATSRAGGDRLPGLVAAAG